MEIEGGRDGGWAAREAIGCGGQGEGDTMRYTVAGGSVAITEEEDY